MPRDVVAVMAPGAGGEPSRWNVNFWVHDADAVAAKATELGGSVVMAPSDGPGMRETVVADQQGVVLSMSQLLAG